MSLVMSPEGIEEDVIGLVDGAVVGVLLVELDSSSKLVSKEELVGFTLLLLDIEISSARVTLVGPVESLDPFM